MKVEFPPAMMLGTSTTASVPPATPPLNRVVASFFFNEWNVAWDGLEVQWNLRLGFGSNFGDPTAGSQITCHLTILWTAAMQVVSRDVIEPLANSCDFFQDPSETTPISPAEVLGRRAGAFAQFRHVTAGTMQVLA
jgi:hypothetical protein